MAEHEPCIGASDDWFTPPEIFSALGLTFDLDPCSPGPNHWVPARRVFTIADDGLSQPWEGLVFMNPPFGGREGHVVWLNRFLRHGNGVAIVRAYTSSGWFHRVVVPCAETLLFPRGKTKFIRPDGSIGGSPGHGVVLIGMGSVANAALQASGLGLFLVVPRKAGGEGRWRSIGSAPKDGTRILAYEDGNIYAAEWVPEMPSCGHWKSFCGQYVTIPPEPTAWMPLPAPPSVEEGNKR